MARGRITEDSNLSDYSISEDESFDEFAEFSPKYQAFRLFRTCMSLQVLQQYPRARKTFYDNLGWFAIMYDSVFPVRCNAIIKKYEQVEYKSRYTYEQIEQLKFMRIVVEFSRMLLDASSKNRTKINTEKDKRVELIPIGYAQILNYEHMSLEFFNRLTQIQQQQSHRDAVKFFNHGLSWFGGIFDAKFVMQGYLIDKTKNAPEVKFRQLVSAFSKLLTRKSITPTAFATLVYKPRPHWDVPKTVKDVVKHKKHISSQESDINEEEQTIAKEALVNRARELKREIIRDAHQLEEIMEQETYSEDAKEKAGQTVAHARPRDTHVLLTVDDILRDNEKKMAARRENDSDIE
jgi:hypothetical protein